MVQSKRLLTEIAFCGLTGFKTYYYTCVRLFGDVGPMPKPKPVVQVIWATFWATADNSVLLR